jgi:hypothetical protein
VELKKSVIKSVTCSLKQKVQSLWRNQAFRWAKMAETESTQRGIDGKWSSEEQTSDENIQIGRNLVPTSLRIPTVILDLNLDKSNKRRI